MFCLSGLRCFVYLDWYVFSVWNDMFFPSGLRCFVYLDWYEHINPDKQNISIQIDKTYHSRQTKHINPDRQNISIQTNKTYHSRQTKHIIPICSVYLDWYVLSIWNDMFCLSRMICFVYLDWYVLSVWNDMFCLSRLICSDINPDRQNISIQTNKTYQSR
jgi:hypothetical protein